jgi:hypothetical protein
MKKRDEILDQKIVLNRAGTLALINSDKTPRLVPPPGGFREEIKKIRKDNVEVKR